MFNPFVGLFAEMKFVMSAIYLSERSDPKCILQRSKRAIERFMDLDKLNLLMVV